MSAEDTSRRARGTEDGNALCQWERTVDGGLIANWRRGCRVANDTQLYGAGIRYRVTHRRHLPIVGRRRASERLGAAAIIAAMYLVVGFAVFSALWGTADAVL